MEWAFRSDLPIYTQLAEKLTQAILSGAYPAGRGCRRCGIWRQRQG